MKIVFAHGYFLYEDEKEKEIMRPYPPLGILYISAYLQQNGMPNSIYDTTFSTKLDWQKFLLAERPQVVALYTNLMTKLNIIETMRFIRRELPQCIIVVGGPDVTHNIANYLQAGAHFVVFGEGEETMLELAQNLQKNNCQLLPAELAAIAGLAYTDEQGGVHKNTVRTKIKLLDSLPMPNREGIDMFKYLEVWKKHHGQSTMSVSTQRGCPYTCRWCSTAVYGQSYRRRSPQVVADELEYLQARYQPDSIWFVDDVFTVSHKWLAAFRDELVRRNLVIPFECITRADRLDESVIAILKEAGAFRIWIGAESGSQRIIDAMDRRVEVNHVRNMIIKARELGIQAGTFIMFGYPGETEADIEETLHHLKTANPDVFTITVAYPIKGTGLYEEVEHASNATLLDWEATTDRQIDFKRTYSRQYYDYAMRYVVNEVNYHKKKLNRQHLSPTGLRLKTTAIIAKMQMWWARQLASKSQ